MLRWFGRSGGSRKEGQGGKGKTADVRQRKSVRQREVEVGVSQNLSEEQRGALMKNVEDAKYKSGLPEEVVSMADQIDSHRSGALFKYAVISDTSSMGRLDAIAKLRSYKPKRSVADLMLGDIPAIRMTGDCLDLVMSNALSKGEKDKMLEFTALDSILIHYVPLDSFTSEGSVVTVQLNDNRKSPSVVLRSASFLDTTAVNILLFLDFYVETADLDKISLSFVCGKSDFVSGVAWGATKVVVSLTSATFPKRLGLANTRGVISLTDTDLEEHDTDPRHVDMVLTPKVLQGLRAMNSRGEIENKTIRLNDGLVVSTAKTMMMNNPEETPVSEVMDVMKKSSQQRPNAIKSALKAPPVVPNTPMARRSPIESWQQGVRSTPPPSDLPSEPEQDYTIEDREITPGESASIVADQRGAPITSEEEVLKTRPRVVFN